MQVTGLLLIYDNSYIVYLPFWMSAPALASILFTHSFNIYCVPGAVLRAGDT